MTISTYRDDHKIETNPLPFPLTLVEESRGFEMVYWNSLYNCCNSSKAVRENWSGARVGS